MSEAFRLGGWGMYPTLLAGVVLVVAAVQYARSPDAGRLRVVRNLQALALLVGTLGFITGVIHGFTSIGELSPYSAGQLAIVCVGEALCCIGLALVTLAPSTIPTPIAPHPPSSGP